MEDTVRMTVRMLLVALAAMAVTYTVGPLLHRSPFDARETAIIERSDSVLYVTVLRDPADSVILRTPSVDLTRRQLRSPQLETLTAKMLATVRSPRQDGVGIAAPQVGIDKRLIAVQRFDKPGAPFETYANVHIEALSGDRTHGPEGCLSVPPLRGLVPRYGTVVVRYVDPGTLLERRDTVHGYTAIIFQHECDHLDGRLYIDRADTVFVSDRWIAERAPFDSVGAYRKPAWWPDPDLRRDAP